ncbi:fibroblast growth factor receptor 2-like isoform X2 [Antedon mediterranea]|uniref:fibroblast growth factor receptor 2-like isoform X2 n=1 Tax=Antedon mediterranea TaxID=105859 RepID=UPI003AF452D6
MKSKWTRCCTTALFYCILSGLLLSNVAEESIIPTESPSSIDGSEKVLVNGTVTDTQEKVEEAPTFYKEMQNIYYVAVGETLKLSCPTNLSPPLIPEWHKNGEATWTTGQHIVGEKLKLRSVVLEDSGNYTCIVSNEFGSINHTFELVVKEPGPPIYLMSVHQGYIRATEADIVTLTCPIVGVPKVDVEWLKSSLPIVKTGRVEVVGDELRMDSANMSDSGNYQCIASNDFGSLTVNITLNITESPPIVNLTGNMAPEFKDGLRKLVLVPAQAVIKLNCPYDADPKPQVTWLKNGNADWRRLDNKKAIEMDGKLKLKDALPFDNGNYTCVVKNEFGSINFTFTVIVKERLTHRPIIKHIKPSENQTVYVGATVTFKCSVLSDLHPYVKWLQWHGDGNFSKVSEREQILTKWGEYWLQNPFWNCSYATSIVFKDRKAPPFTCLSTEMHNEKEGSTDLTVEVLTIENVQVTDSGHFTCMASNSLGVSEEHAYLNVLRGFETTSIFTSISSGNANLVPINNREMTTPTLDSVHRSKSTDALMYIAVSIACIFVLLCIIVMFKCFNRKKESLHTQLARVNDKMVLNRQYSNDSGRSTAPFFPVRGRLSSSMTVVSEFELPFDPEWEFPRDRLTVSSKILGEGAFGQVVLGVAVGLKGAKEHEPYTVAIKMLKANATDRELSDLMSEMDMMKNIGKHVNIINMLGCCTQDGPPFVLVEYAPNGNLRDYLRMRRPPDGIPPEKLVLMPEIQTLTNRDLLSMAYQVAKGMEFLASKKCIHRDLAARNVLVTEDLVMKIADFGLARDIHYVDYYKKTTDGRLPVKWMAPEALFDRVFTTESDVWSYGVLLWEIMTLGGTPYPSVPVEKMFDYLKAGKRMEQPQNCPLEVYHIMRETWQTNRAFRPTFPQLAEDLARTLEMSTSQEYLELEALGDHPLTTFLDSEVDSGNSSSHSRHSSESTV